MYNIYTWICVYMCMHGCVCVFVCMYVCMCEYMYMYLSVSVYTCMSIWVPMFIYECACMHVYACQCMCSCMCACTRMHVRASVYVLMFIVCLLSHFRRTPIGFYAWLNRTLQLCYSSMKSHYCQPSGHLRVKNEEKEPDQLCVNDTLVANHSPLLSWQLNWGIKIWKKKGVFWTKQWLPKPQLERPFFWTINIDYFRLVWLGFMAYQPL